MSRILSVWGRLAICAAIVACRVTFAAPPDDDTPPSAPGNLVATAVSGSQINLSWTAATDQHPIVSYVIARCTGAGCSNYVDVTAVSTLSYADTGLASGTVYRYVVMAVDSWANIGPGATAQATTPDLTAPSTPGGLGASTASGTQINLSWSASTDNIGVSGYAIERCDGAGCSSFSPITTTASTSFNSTGLSPATSYSFRVRAYDAASNYGGYSNTAAATTTDTVAPSSTTGLNAGAAGGTQINLSWSAASDNVGVSGYVVERCSGAGCSSFSPITTIASTSYSSTGLTSATTYSFRVRAYDAASNYGGYSNTASATTADTAAPSTPGGLGAGAAGGTQINLSWSASSDNVGVSGYAIERCDGAGCSSFSQIATTASTSYSSTGLSPATSYSFRVRAYDAASNYSGYSTTASATTTDTVAPSTPSGVGAGAASGTQINLTWSASSDNVGVSGYAIERCQGAGCSSFSQIATTASTSYSSTGLSPATSYSFRVRAYDSASNYSGYSSTAAATTTDTVAPSSTTALSASAGGGAQINLSWSAATDNVGVSGYAIERCQGAACSSFSQITTTASTSYSNTGLTSATAYSFRVRAYDAASNYGGYSSTASATTTDTVAPSIPSSAIATQISGTQINVSWSASTDNVAVTGYALERCQGSACSNFVQIATPTATSHSDTGLANVTTYRYRVRARDAVPNYSDYSMIVAATTVDSTAPPAPASLSATTASSTQINLSWPASTDNVGVTGYAIERCQGAACTSFSQIATTASTTYSSTGLTTATAYRFRLRAYDAASNYSGYTSTATATTTDTVAPSSTTGLSATAAGATQINLTWTAATDNVGVTGYAIERCQGAACSSFSQIATTASTTYSSTGLTTATSYSFRVRAYDAVPNYGGYSSTASATTTDTIAPSIPGAPGATAISGTQINVSWSASTDNVAVTAYAVERCQGSACTNFVQIATPSTTSLSDTGRTNATTYRYRVRARDAVPNYSGYSTIVSATTPDAAAPTTPGALSLTAGPNQLTLSWTASTDNVGVTAYLIERCAGSGCSYVEIASVATTTYTDTSVSVATSYTYRVRARDAANNRSGYATTGAAMPANCD